MAKLSKLTSNKSRKSNNERSKLMQRMASRPIKKDNSFLGDFFLTTNKENLLEKLGKCNIVTNRTIIEGYNIFFDGLQSSVDIENDSIFDFGIEDFTIDWWEYKLPLPEPNYDGVSSIQYSFFKSTSNGKQPIAVKDDGNKLFYASSDGDSWDISDGKYMGSIELNKWTHWAVIKSSDKFYTFKNGRVRNIWECNKPINSSKEFFTIGSGPKNGNFYGYIKNFRIVKNMALWSEEFTPNSEELFY